MKWYIGIDGGGTKTSIAIGTNDGTIRNAINVSGCSYREIGIENTVSILVNGIQDIILSVNAKPSDCMKCCIGLPCYGENDENDKVIKSLLEEKLKPIPVIIVNDGIVGWAGSLDCQPGIHLVAGTGSIAIGCDSNRNFARCGGWCEQFGDEGSCYWIGKNTMQLFSKEADGRLPKSELYQIVKETYKIENDYDFIEMILQDVFPYRDKVAAFQKISLEAANAGDKNIIKLYKKAAKELALMVKGVIKQLNLEGEKINVSYFGGLFHAEEYIIPTLREELGKLNCILCKPKYSATRGALFLAINDLNKEDNNE